MQNRNGSKVRHGVRPSLKTSDTAIALDDDMVVCFEVVWLLSSVRILQCTQTIARTRTATRHAQRSSSYVAKSGSGVCAFL
jgi:hypothetical protein